MNSHVLLEIAITGKCLVTDLAAERFDPCVLPLVDGEIHLGVVALGAPRMGTPILVGHIAMTLPTDIRLCREYRLLRNMQLLEVRLQMAF